MNDGDAEASGGGSEILDPRVRYRGPGLELIVLRFVEPGGAAAALRALQYNPAPHRRWVEEAAVVERQGSGRVSIRGTFAGHNRGGIAEADDTKAGIAVGAIGGGVIGVFFGPVGIIVGLFGGATLGGLFGSIRGGDTTEHAVFDKIKTQLPRGSSALMLLADADTIHESTTFGVGEADQVRQVLADDEVDQVRKLILDAGAA
jgi:uncharacterized membrane protein